MRALSGPRKRGRACPHLIKKIRFEIIFKEKSILQKVKEFILSRGDLELTMAQVEKNSENFGFFQI